MEKDCCACEYTYSDLDCIDDCELEMTIEEAIEILKYYRPIGAINAGFPEEPGEDVKAFNLAIETLEKQIAYKPDDVGRAYTGERIGTCKCGNDEVFEHEKHCSNCGQKLDWEE